MSHKNPHGTHVGKRRQMGSATTKVTTKVKTKVKALLKRLLPFTSRKKRVIDTSTECQTDENKRATNRRDGIAIPLLQIPSIPSILSEASPTVEINRYIWGENGAVDMNKDDKELISNRVYALLKLENSPILEHLDQDGGFSLEELPEDVKRSFERVIRAEIQRLQ
ncbi:hypothetical protein F4777DRAFT_557892 [Nemania sp. FL0916]|nr:hypothetical protein F4777DRAFT_557892 [Nemania sp. FL0916]